MSTECFKKALDEAAEVLNRLTGKTFSPETAKNIILSKDNSAAPALQGVFATYYAGCVLQEEKDAKDARGR